MFNKMLAIVAICSVVLIGCGEKSAVNFQLDNPLEVSINVTLDGKKYELAPKSYAEVSLNNGTHTVEYAGEKAKFNVVEGAKGGIINPTLSTYYVHYNVYLYNPPADPEALYAREKSYLSSERINVITIKGHEVEMSARQESGLIVENYVSDVMNWQLGLDEEFKSVVELVNKNVTVLGKVFRESDYIAYVEESYGAEIPAAEGYVPQRGILSQVQRTIPPLNLQHECKSLNDYFQKMETQLDALHRAGTSNSEIKEAQNEILMVQVSTYKAKEGCETKFVTPEGTFDRERSDAYNQPELDFNARMSGVRKIHVFVIAGK